MAKKEKKVIKPGKAITAAKADDIRNKLLKIPEQNIKELVLDFAKVDTVDSVGLGLTLSEDSEDRLHVSVPLDVIGAIRLALASRLHAPAVLARTSGGRMRVEKSIDGPGSHGSVVSSWPGGSPPPRPDVGSPHSNGHTN